MSDIKAIKIEECAGKTVKLVHHFFDDLTFIFDDGTYAAVKSHQDYDEYTTIENVDFEDGDDQPPYNLIAKAGIITTEEANQLGVAWLNRRREKNRKKKEAQERLEYDRLRAKFERKEP